MGATRETQYEPFGEKATVPLSPLQRRVSHAGIAMFWTLVASIVVTRAFLFVPHGIDTTVAAAMQAARTALGLA